MMMMVMKMARMSTRLMKGRRAIMRVTKTMQTIVGMSRRRRRTVVGVVGVGVGVGVDGGGDEDDGDEGDGDEGEVVAAGRRQLC